MLVTEGFLGIVDRFALTNETWRIDGVNGGMQGRAGRLGLAEGLAYM